MSRFQSTRPIRGATCAQSIVEFAQDISIHAPHTGRDTPWSTPWTGSPYFNPRAPYGARLALIWRPAHDQNFNPRAPYGARPQARPGSSRSPNNFNPRAPYGARPCVAMPFFAHANFNPRAPYGARLSRRPWARWPPHFNPRAPYGARRPDRWRSCGPAYFNPRAPYGARLQVQILIRTDKIISIHAPHTGRDWLMVPGILYTWEFQSTRPIRGATSGSCTSWPTVRYFNPRAPYGARPLFGL